MRYTYHRLFWLGRLCLLLTLSCPELWTNLLIVMICIQNLNCQQIFHLWLMTCVPDRNCHQTFCLWSIMCSGLQLSSNLSLMIDHCVQNWNCQQTFYLWLMTCLELELTTNLLLVISNLCSELELTTNLLLVISNLCSELELTTNLLLVVGDVFQAGTVIKPFTCRWWCVPNWNCQENFYL